MAEIQTYTKAWRERAQRVEKATAARAQKAYEAAQLCAKTLAKEFEVTRVFFDRLISGRRISFKLGYRFDRRGPRPAIILQSAFLRLTFGR